MTEDVRRELLLLMARLVTERDAALREAAEHRRDEERVRQRVARADAAAARYQKTLAFLTDSHGLTEEQARPYLCVAGASPRTDDDPPA